MPLCRASSAAFPGVRRACRAAIDARPMNVGLACRRRRGALARAWLNPFCGVARTDRPLGVSVTGLVAVGKAGGLSSPVARCLPACVPRRARSALCCPAYQALARGPRYLAMGVISSERRQAGGANRRGCPSIAVTQSSSPADALCGAAGSWPPCGCSCPNPAWLWCWGRSDGRWGATGSCAQQKSCRSRESGQTGHEVYAYGAGGLADRSQFGNRA
jgi:hypothetical protein